MYRTEKNGTERSAQPWIVGTESDKNLNTIVGTESDKNLNTMMGTNSDENINTIVVFTNKRSQVGKYLQFISQ